MLCLAPRSCPWSKVIDGIHHNMGEDPPDDTMGPNAGS